jgi:hypothetical protein
MDECPICLLQNDLETITTECCKNKFHKECYNKCMEYKKECPLCRTPQKADHIITMTEVEIPVCKLITRMILISGGTAFLIYLASLVLPPRFN